MAGRDPDGPGHRRLSQRHYIDRRQVLSRRALRDWSAMKAIENLKEVRGLRNEKSLIQPGDAYARLDHGLPASIKGFDVRSGPTSIRS